MTDKKREPMDIGFSVFNGHCNNAFDRVRVALDEFAPSYMERVDEVSKKGGGIMAIFDEEPSPETAAYAALIAFVVNGHAGEASDDDSDKLPDVLVRCDNCEWTGTEAQIEVTYGMVPDLAERTAPGEIIPSGECPECGCLAHPVVNAATDWKEPEAAGDAKA